MGQLLIFEGFDNLNDDTLWYSNGEATGSDPVTVDGDGGSVIGASLFGDELSLVGPTLFAYGGVIYFDGDVPDGGGFYSQGLWVSQATTASTQMIDAGDTGSGLDPQDFIAYAGKVYFNGSVSEGLLTGSELFVTNGTASGTAEISSQDLNPSSMAVYDNLLFMNGDNGVNQYSEAQYGMFSYNANGGAIEEIGPSGSNASDPLGFDPQDLVAALVESLFGGLADDLFMSGMDSSGSTNLYVYSGSTLTQITPSPTAGVGAGGLAPQDITALATPLVISSEVVGDLQAVYFSGVDSSGLRGLWSSYGTSYSSGALGTSGPTEVAAGSLGGSPDGLDPYDMVALGGDLYFTGYDNALGTDADQRGLFVYDPLTNKTTEIVTSAEVAVQDADVNAWGDLTPNALTVYDGTIYFDGAFDEHGSAAYQQPSLWEVTPVVTDPGTYSETISGTAQRLDISDNGVALTPLYLTTYAFPEPPRDVPGIGFKSSYEAVYDMTETGGLLKIIDTADADAVVKTISLAAGPISSASAYADGVFSLVSDGVGGTEIDFTPLANVVSAPDDVLVSNLAGQSYAAYEQFYRQGVYQGLDTFYASPINSAYASYDYDYSAGGSFIGSRFFYVGVTGLPYTGYEYDFSAANQLVRADYTGDTTDPFSSFEYDYVDGVFAGSKYVFTSVPAGSDYSSYETDSTYNGALAGEKFFFTDVANQDYTGAEEDFDANGNLSRLLLTGVTGQAYSSLEEDFLAGDYQGYKADYVVKGQSYSNEQVDVSSSGALEKIIYSGFKGSPYSSIEQDYAGSAVADTIYSFTDVSGQNYYAYQVEDDPKGGALTETFDLSNGNHTEIALTGGLTLTSLGGDKMTGSASGSTTFVFNAIYGAATITNLTSADLVSLPSAEFTNFQALFDAATPVGGNVEIRAGDGDSLTLKNMTMATLQNMGGNFTFHP